MFIFVDTQKMLNSHRFMCQLIYVYKMCAFIEHTLLCKYFDAYLANTTVSYIPTYI